MGTKNITLTSVQAVKLIANKFVEIDQEQSIEIYDNKLILNNNGEVFELDSLEAGFNKKKIDYEESVNFIRSLICDYFHFEPYQVLYSSGMPNHELVFNINFYPGLNLYMLVADKSTASINSRELYLENVGKQIDTENTVGVYRKLGDSGYYFRWLDDFE